MSLSLSTPIMGYRPAFDPAVILSRMDRPDANDRAFFVALVTWCKVAGVDPAVPAAQFLLETGNGTSIRWTRDLNASGMGIVSDGTAQPFKITSVDVSARLFVQCLYALVKRKAHPGIPLQDDVQRWFERVWLPKVQSKAMPNVTKLADLGLRYIENGDSRATWSWEKGTGSMDAYGNKLVSRIKEFYPNLPDRGDPPVTTPSTPEEPVEPGAPVATYNYDNGVPPDYVDIHVSEANKFAGYIDPDNHWIGIFFIHSAYGDLEGTTGWMVGGNALTDTMVGNSYDGPALDGQLRRFNNAYGNRYAWSSGPVKNPVEDAAKFLELYGPNKEVINSHGTAMERSCGPNVATNHVTEKEHRKRCQEIAYHANKYGKRIKKLTGKDGLTCDTFPLIATENNRSFLAYHGEANEDKRETCPDKHVRATIDRIIADVRVILAGWQLGAVTIPPLPEEPNPQDKYAAVKVIPELQAYLGNDANGNPILPPAIVTVGKRVYVMVNDRVKATKAIKRRQTAEEDAEVIGPVIAKGTEFAALWLFQNDDGTPWYITPWWTRIPVADTTRVADAA